MWLLNLLMSPKVLAALGIAAMISIGSAFYYGYSKGYELADLRGRQELSNLVSQYQRAANAARIMIAEKQKELDAAQQEYIQMSVERIRRNRVLQEELNEYKEKLADRPECRLDDSDIDSLPAF